MEGMPLVSTLKHAPNLEWISGVLRLPGRLDPDDILLAPS